VESREKHTRVAGSKAVPSSRAPRDCERPGRGTRLTLRRIPSSTIQTLSASDDTPDIDLRTNLYDDEKLGFEIIALWGTTFCGCGRDGYKGGMQIACSGKCLSVSRRVCFRAKVYIGRVKLLVIVQVAPDRSEFGENLGCTMVQGYVDIRHNMRATQGSRAGDAGAGGRKSKARNAVSRRRDGRVGVSPNSERSGATCTMTRSSDSKS
jgi:hypothetical protein